MACLLTLAVALVPARVDADADEASLHGQALGGVVRTSDHQATGTGTLIGGALRGTLARSDRWAFELTVAGFEAALRHPDAVGLAGGVPVRGVVERTQFGGRAEFGVHASFGVRWIPTVHVALGGQVRRLGATTLRSGDGMVLASISAGSAVDATLALGLGLDRRLGRSMMLGVSVAAVRAQPLGGDAEAMTSVEATLHVAWYFYPRWFSLAGWRGSHGGGG